LFFDLFFPAQLLYFTLAVDSSFQDKHLINTEMLSQTKECDKMTVSHFRMLFSLYMHFSGN